MEEKTLKHREKEIPSYEKRSQTKLDKYKGKYKCTKSFKKKIISKYYRQHTKKKETRKSMNKEKEKILSPNWK